MTHLGNFEQKHGENVLLCSTLRLMLKLDPVQRPSFNQLLGKMPPYNDVVQFLNRDLAYQHFGIPPPEPNQIGEPNKDGVRLVKTEENIHSNAEILAKENENFLSRDEGVGVSSTGIDKDNFFAQSSNGDQVLQ